MELGLREKNMQSGAPEGGITDQWRVYQHVIAQLQSGPPLRLMVQASAGTGRLAAFLFKPACILGFVLRLTCSEPCDPPPR